MKWNERYVPLNPEKSADHENSLRVYVSYDLGGPNMWCGGMDQRGYYLFCAPIKREGGATSWIMGKGLKILLKTVNRASQSALDEAIAIAKEKERELIEGVLAKYNLELAEGDESKE